MTATERQDETQSSADPSSYGVPRSKCTFVEKRPVSADNAFNAVYQGALGLGWPDEPSKAYFDEEASKAKGSDDGMETENMDLASMAIQGFQMALQVGVAPPDCLPRGLTQTLVSTYYNSCQQTFRCFKDQNTLLSLLDQASHEATALKYASCAHSLSLPIHSRLVLAGDSDAQHARFFYHLARAALNQSDMGKRSTTLLLQTLQATILVGLYELQNAEFSCGWLSASRAVWLVDELRLYWLDSDKAPTLAHEEQAQEARRTFWAASGLASLLMMVNRDIGFASKVVDETTTYIPVDTQCQSLRISHVYHGMAPRLLSVEEGLFSVRYLSRRLLLHASQARRWISNSCLDSQPYSFWTHQSRLEESLNHIHALTEAWSVSSNGSTLEVMLLHVHIKALFVVLGETKLARMGLKKYHTFGFEHGQAHCCEGATHRVCLELAAALEGMDKMLPSDAATGITASWAAYVTLQSLLRHQWRQQMSWLSIDFHQLSSIENDICHDIDVGLNKDLVTMSPYHSSLGFPWTSPNTLVTDTLAHDLFESLQSTLNRWAAKIPIASFFAQQIQLEIVSSMEDLESHVVGLADSTWASMPTPV